jgi:DNA-binding CsgD family transcriptional regulator
LALGREGGVAWEPTPFVGRALERSLIEDLFREARLGRSRSLVFVGEPGIGKSALLAFGREHASGMLVLSTTGEEATRRLPFIHLADLIEPLDGVLADLDGQHQMVLRLALGRSTEGRIPDRHAVGVAVLELFGRAAESTPLAIFVDDAQWVDSSTADALTFAARRFVADPIAMVIGVRQDEPSPFVGSDNPSVVLAGLDEVSAIELLGPDVDPGVVGQLVDATSGNPLALQNAVRELSEDQRAGRRGLGGPVPVGDALAEAFARRAADLDQATRLVMLLAAAEPQPELGIVTAAATQLGVDAEATIRRATSSGLISMVGSRLVFKHPLVRAALYHQATNEERRAAHRALGATLRRDDDLAQRAMHLASATIGPDEATATVVEDAATAAKNRGAYAEAAEGYSLASSLSPSQVDAHRRAVQSADAYFLGGNTKTAIRLLDAALRATDDPIEQADLHLRRFHAGVVAGKPLPTLYEEIVGAADQIRDHDRVRAAQLDLSAALAALPMGRVHLMEKAAMRAFELASGPPVRDSAAIVLALSHIAAGREAEGLPPLIAFGRGALALPYDADIAQLIASVGLELSWADQLPLAGGLLDALVSSIRASSSPAHASQVLANRGWVHFYAGDWVAALAEGTEALSLGEETGQARGVNYAKVMLAAVEAGRGQPEAREHIHDAIADFLATGAFGLAAWAQAVAGFLEQGYRQPREAIKFLESAEQLMSENGELHPTIVPSATELVEAHVRVGDRTGAESWFKVASERADRCGNASVFAQVLRCRGLLVQSSEVESTFKDALHWHESSPRPFERARTELCYGERLRRDRSPTDAVAHLHVAREVFITLGATPWVERSESELQACGVVVQAPSDSELSTLTPQELQVALIVAGGATNRQAATSLFLSRRTVEFHLAAVYRKLGVRSRSQLARRIPAVSHQDARHHDTLGP